MLQWENTSSLQRGWSLTDKATPSGRPVSHFTPPIHWTELKRTIIWVAPQSRNPGLPEPPFWSPAPLDREVTLLYSYRIVHCVVQGMATPGLALTSKKTLHLWGGVSSWTSLWIWDLCLNLNGHNLRTSFSLYLPRLQQSYTKFILAL